MHSRTDLEFDQTGHIPHAKRVYRHGEGRRRGREFILVLYKSCIHK